MASGRALEALAFAKGDAIKARWWTDPDSDSPSYTNHDWFPGFILSMDELNATAVIRYTDDIIETVSCHSNSPSRALRHLLSKGYADVINSPIPRFSPYRTIRVDAGGAACPREAAVGSYARDQSPKGDSSN